MHSHYRYFKVFILFIVFLSFSACSKDEPKKAGDGPLETNEWRLTFDGEVILEGEFEYDTDNDHNNSGGDITKGPYLAFGNDGLFRFRLRNNNVVFAVQTIEIEDTESFPLIIDSTPETSPVSIYYELAVTQTLSENRFEEYWIGSISGFTITIDSYTSEYSHDLDEQSFYYLDEFNFTYESTRGIRREYQYVEDYIETVEEEGYLPIKFEAKFRYSDLFPAIQ